jgi:hypothetical protein
MIELTHSPAQLRDLQAHARGELIYPGDRSYDAARRVWNGMIDKYPALIVRCADAVDIIRAIQLGRREHLQVAVRSGGHSLSGSSVCDGGMVIDLSRMKGICIDPEKRTAWVQAGLTLGEFVQATQAWGLATTTGTVAGTGLAGLTLGGGLGWFMGKYGLTVDNLLAVDLVTAGGGGNFGIATAFKFQLHPVGEVLAGKVVYPIERAREILRFYREYTSTAPDELTAYASFMRTPGGLPVIAISLCYCGPFEEGERLFGPIRKLGAPLVDLIRPKTYLKMIMLADAGAPAGRSYYEKARTLADLSDEAIETMVEYGRACPPPFSHY